MQSKQSAIGTLMQLGTKARESALKYSQLSSVNASYVQRVKRPMNAIDDRVLNDLEEPYKACQDDLETYMTTYANIHKSFIGDETEDDVLKKIALDFYDGAMRSTDFDTVFMVKIINGLQESDNYRFILMEMAWDINYFDSDFKLMSKAGNIVKGMAILLAGVGLIIAIVGAATNVGVALGMGIGFTSMLLGAPLLFFIGEFISNNTIPSLSSANRTNQNTITGRYGYFTHIERGLHIKPDLKEIVSDNREEIAFSDPEQVSPHY